MLAQGLVVLVAVPIVIVPHPGAISAVFDSAHEHTSTLVQAISELHERESVNYADRNILAAAGTFSLEWLELYRKVGVD